jgi:TolB-like protein/DNA-binding winged helix-turn-helix (wHTH) protein/Flp pilus assembly protein TadD
LPRTHQFRFGPFELDMKLGELRRAGERLPLQGQPLQILELLLLSPKQLVSREELRQALWPEGTFVDFDDVLNNGMRRLRQVLEDNAGEPRFIETLPRRGYRFLAEVELVADSKGAEAVNEKDVVPAVVGPAKWRRRMLLLMAIATILVIAGAVWLARRHSPTDVTVIHSIAVLPLENLSGDATQEYLADGMTDALITNLAQLHSIRVVSRTSVMQYKSAHKSLPQIARELDVDGIVQGSVARSGQNLRITAQLIYAPADRHIWAESYDRDFHDVVRLQDEVALAIAQQVRGKLSAQDRALFSGAGSVDPEVSDDYLKGRYFWNKFTADGVNKSIDYYQQAIKKDPAYAPAHVGLADSYMTQVQVLSLLSPRDGCEKAKAELKNALELDGARAEAHGSLGWIKMHYDWDLVGTENELRRALELNPNYSQAHHQYAHFLTATGRMTEALAESKHALELDPYGVRVNSHQGWHYLYARDYDQAIRDFQRTLAMEPNDGYSRRYLAVAYEQKGMYLEALTELQKTPPGPAQTPVLRAALGHAYALAGNHREALAILGELETNAKQQYVSALDIALIHLGMGERRVALDWLEKAYHEHSWFLIYLKVDPRFDALRSDPHFQDIVRRVGLKPR